MNDIDALAEQMQRESREHLRHTLPEEAVDNAVCDAGWFAAAVYKRKYENEIAMNKHNEIRWKD
jgi:hypothetical protein